MPDHGISKAFSATIEANGEDLPPSRQPSAIVSVEALINEHPNLRSPVIEGLVRAGEVVNIVAKAKVGKSWLLYYILLCLATGTTLFGRFRCTRGRVLLVDNELHQEDIAHRIPIVANAMGLRPEEYQSNLDILSLRGALRNINDLTDELNRFPERYQLIALDAFYRALPEGVAENSNEGMAGVYNTIDHCTTTTGSAFANVHHATKGGQGDKDVTDVGSGAGAQSRAADTHMILRPHKEENCVVLDAVTRSWQPIEPLALRWEFPLWRVAGDLDPEALKGRTSRYTEEQESKDVDGKRQILNALRLEADTIKGLKGRIGMGSARIERLVGSLNEERKVTFEKVKIRGQECRKYVAVD